MGVPKYDFKQICELYKGKQKTRIELVHEFNISLYYLNSVLKRKKIELWDRKRTISWGKKEKKKHSNRYYHWKEDKSRLAKIFYEHNA